MEFLRGSRPRKVTVKAEGSGPQGDDIRVPYLGDIGDARTRAEPSSGYDRATWFAQNTMGVPQGRARFVGSDGRAAIGSNARGVNGTVADEYWTDSYWTGYNVVNNPEEYTKEAADVGDIWDVQTQASKGLNYLTWDQVYVNQDTQSVWS